jgi:hypothetical protein
MNISEDIPNWSLLVAEERQLRVDLASAALAPIDDDGVPVEDERAPNVSDLREWWRTVHLVLTLLPLQPNWYREPSILELLTTIGRLAGCLSVGEIPTPISQVAKLKGRRSPTPSEVEDIRWAVTYHHAAVRGLIDNPRYSKTIKEYFGLLDTRAVQAWVKRYSPHHPSSHDDDPLTIIHMTRRAGAHYRACNQRTQSRITSRRKGEGRI